MQMEKYCVVSYTEKTKTAYKYVQNKISSINLLKQKYDADIPKTEHPSSDFIKFEF